MQIKIADLPSGYTAREWIAGETSSSRVTIPYHVNQNTQLKLIYTQLLESTSVYYSVQGMYPFCGIAQSSFTNILHTFGDSPRQYHYFTVTEKPDKWVVERNGKTITVNGITHTFNDNTFETSDLRLIYGNKVYNNIEIGENDILLYNLICCTRDSDNKVGLYDIINNTFYEGTGTFTYSESTMNTGLYIKTHKARIMTTTQNLFDDSNGVACFSSTSIVSFNPQTHEFSRKDKVYDSLLKSVYNDILKPNTTYAISVIVSKNTYNGIAKIMSDSRFPFGSQSYVTIPAGQTGTFTVIWTTPSTIKNDYGWLWINTYNDVIGEFVFKVQIEENNQATPYVPYGYIPINKGMIIANQPGGYELGDQITTTRSGSTLTFDVVDFDNQGYIPADNTKTNTMQLLMHDVQFYDIIPFSAPQLLCYFVNGLPAGKYRFTLDHARYANGTEYDGTYMFTLTQPIPAKGGFRHTNIGGWKSAYTKADVIGNYLTTYNPTTTGGAALESNKAVAEWDGDESCVDLGTFTAQNRTYYTEALSITIGGTTYTGNRNYTERNAFGSNRWRDSVYRQWLNSDATAVPSSDISTISNWWVPATVFDRVPSGAKLAGYLYGMDVDFVKAIGEVAVKTTLHPCDRVGSETFDITYDKVYLASRKDIFGTDEFWNISEGELFEYFRNATDADRIKYQNGTARYWWLRTAITGTAYNVRLVTSEGTLHQSDAGHAYGIIPACSFVGNGTYKKVKIK